MSDLSDRFLETASALQDAVVREKIDAARLRQCDQPQFVDWDRKTCYDCGCEMHPTRLLLGRVRCVACQEAEESLAGRRGR